MKCDASVDFSTPLSEMPALAAATEELGFDALWTSETRHDALLPLVLAAEHTRRIQLGTAVAVAFARSPFVVAQMAWDLARFSDGRLILGLGTQVKAHIERRFGMPWAPPAPRLKEFVTALRTLWDCWQKGTRPNFRGEFYKLTLLTPFFDPGPIAHPDIPIYTAGVGKPLCRVAGEVADGFMVHPFHTRRYLEELIRPAIAEGAQASNRPAAAVRICVLVFVAAGDVEREAVRAQIAFYASTPSYRPVLELHGWGAIGEQLSSMAARGRWDEMPANVSDEMLQTVAIVASSENLPGEVQRRYAGLADRLTLYRSFVPGTADPQWKALIAAVHGD